MPVTRILRNWYIGFFCMVVLDVSIFNCFSHFSCNVMFESDFTVQAIFLPLPFFVADLLHRFWMKRKVYRCAPERFVVVDE